MRNLLSFSVFYLLFIPINANIIVLNGLTHVHQGSSGQLITGIIKLKNTGDSEERVIIYFNDLFQNCDENTVLTASLTHERSIQKWFSTEVNEYVLKPKQEYDLAYTINVPDNSLLKGSYWGVLMVEIEEPIREEQLEYSVKLESKVRYGIQIIADINQKTSPELDFHHIEILKKENVAKSIQVVLKNLGIFYVQPTIILELFNENGEQAKKIEVTFKKIYPNNCKTFHLDISDLPKGLYSGVLVADYGENMYAIDVDFEI